MELKLCKSFKKLWLPNPKTVVAMQVEEQSIDSTRKIELLVKKGFKTFIWDTSYLRSYCINDAWVTQQLFLRLYKQKINIIFHIDDSIDLLSLAAIGNTYPVYLNKYATINFKSYKELPSEHRSDVRIMLGKQVQYLEFANISNSEDQRLSAVEAQATKLITGIGDSYFTKVIAATFLPQPREVDNAKFLHIEDLLDDYLY